MSMELTKAQVKALFNLMKQNKKVLEFNTIVYNHGYAYYTNLFVVIRWRLDGYSDLKDGSFIDLNNRTDMDKSLAMWMKLATAKQTIDLNTKSLWNDPEKWEPTFNTNMHSAIKYPSKTFMFFDNRRGVNKGDDTSAMFNFSIVKELGVLLNSGKGIPFLYFIPVVDGDNTIILSMHYVIGNDDDVASVLKPMMPPKDGKRPLVTYGDIMSGNDRNRKR